MKAIPGNTTGPQWSSKLFDDLTFIKKHRRYPVNLKTLLPLSSFFLILILGSRFIYTMLFTHASTLPFIAWVAMVFVAVCIFGVAYSAYSILRFKSILTPFLANENMRLVDEFLRSQQLNVYRHPQAPEVLQILSRPLGNKSEQREVMIFIADDKRILINSHFINQKWTISPQSRNVRQMANRLREWLKIHYPNTNTGIVAR